LRRGGSLVNNDFGNAARPGRTAPLRTSRDQSPSCSSPAARDPFKARDRASAVDDENPRAAFEPVDQGAEAILGFTDANSFHVAIIAYSQKLVTMALVTTRRSI
jgi:hypothetical protein